MKQTKKISNIIMYIFMMISIIFSINALQPVVDLGTAGNFVILTKSGITNVHTSNITGDIGSSPITSAAMDNIFCSEITGTIYGANAAYTGSSDITCFAGGSSDNTLVANAVSDMETAYTNAAGRIPTDFLDAGTGELGGLTLAPGLYTFTTGVTISTDVTINGSSTDVWIFQIPGTLDISNGKQILLTGGALPENIFWQVAGVTTLGTTSVFNGNILSGPGVGVDEAIAINTGATLNGRALSQKAVTLQSNIISLPSSTPVLTTITLSPTSVNLTLGNISTSQLTVTSLNQFGLPIATLIIYNSSNSSVATVNASGFVTALISGNTTIIAYNGTKNGTSLIRVQTITPILNSIGSKNIVQANLLNFTLTATSPSGVNLTYTINGKPATASFTDNLDGTAIFSWTPNSSDIGVTNVNFSVSDGLKSANETVAITVNLFDAPTTTIPTDTSQNTNFNVTLNATGFNSTPIAYINYTLNNVSGQIIGSTGNVSINTSGNNTLTYYAVDTSGNIEAQNTLYAILENISPSITSFILSSSSITIGDTVTGTCIATDNLDSNPITNITGIDTTTTGIKTATCIATDAAGNTNSSNLNYTVNERTSGGGGGGGSSYDFNWVCGDVWSTCNENGIKTQTCTKKNSKTTLVKEEVCAIQSTQIISNKTIENINPIIAPKQPLSPTNIADESQNVKPTDVQIIDDKSIMPISNSETQITTNYVPKKSTGFWNSIGNGWNGFAYWITHLFN